MPAAAVAATQPPAIGPSTARMDWPRRFSGRALARIAMPRGGVAAGSISLGGRGQLRDWEIFNRPDKGNQPARVFASVWAKPAGGKAVAMAAESRRLPPFEGQNGLGADNVPGLPRLSAPSGFTMTARSATPSTSLSAAITTRAPWRPGRPCSPGTVSTTARPIAASPPIPYACRVLARSRASGRSEQDGELLFGRGIRLKFASSKAASPSASSCTAASPSPSRLLGSPNPVIRLSGRGRKNVAAQNRYIISR